MAREERLRGPELSSARAALSGARGKRRLQIILEARDPGALLRALPAEDLYFTIREIGIADAAPLVPLASAEQFRAFLDLDAWQGDRLDPRRALTWLRAARAGSQRDPRAEERWRRKLSGLDRELLSFLLRESLVVHDLSENPDPEVQGESLLTPEGQFLVEFRAKGAEYSALRGLLDDLYAQDPFQAGRLLTSLRFDLPSELEESALRWRTGRLADLGIPSAEEAASWFARPPRTPVARPGLPKRPPGFFLAALASQTLLDRGVAELPAADRPGVQAQIASAANAALVADRVDLVDPEAVRTAFQAARALLEMGLEVRLRTEGHPLDGAGAAAVLAAVPVKRIFQDGFGRVLDLRSRAEGIIRAGFAGTQEAPLLDAPLAEALFALPARRPRYFPGLEARREDWATPTAAAFVPRPFLATSELDRTGAALDLGEGLVRLARTLGLAPEPKAAPARRLTALYLTALAGERLGRGFAPGPLAASEVPGAIAALATVDDPRLGAAGEPGALLLELARARAAELRSLAGAGEASPERVADLWVELA